ncbi:hypothetical protein SAMN04515618_13014 [Collimonas sp. OK307]|uniref:hypothetical protein n=1 Tax=Collimonas sp. OK307 TaxID=1801620 RepID=UPI0008E058B9|nr:hypothetical protein [Collimonas sp. OK307]SFI48736.1 hypothetical protein SAMN04515618_13014 [Collimonas sp. OK307]
MNQHIFFILCNIVGATLIAIVFYPIFKAKTAPNLNEAFKTWPELAKITSNKYSRNYNRSCIYFSIALAAYVVIAIGNDVEVDLDLAMTSLVILFAVTFARVWSLRKPLARP